MTHYDDLEVSSGASVAEIRAAYLRLARRHHPDQAGAGPDDVRRMQDVNEAWRVLSDPDRRRTYDRSLRTPPADSPPPEWGGDTDWLTGHPGVLPPDAPGERRPMLAVPVLLLGAGLGAIVVSLTTGLRPLLVAGVAAVAAAAVLFVAVPLLVLSEARRREGDGHHR